MTNENSQSELMNFLTDFRSSMEEKINKTNAEPRRQNDKDGQEDGPTKGRAE